MSCFKLTWIIAGLLTCVFPASATRSWSQELRYRLQPNQKFSYKVTVTVDEDDKLTTYQGNTHYEVNSANTEQATLTYRGGLSESSKAKQNRQASGGFGPPGFGGPFGPRGFGGPPSPFSRPAFAGKVQTTNRITLTGTGRVLAMEGDSHLPFLLGNVSLMPFEILPKDNERQWVVDSGVSISEEEENRRGFGSFGPMGPRFGNNPNKNVQAASEVTRYSIQQDEGDLVTIKKSYQLTSPGADGESFDMNGAGTWVFNKKENVPESLDVSLKLISKEGNSSTTFPITIKIERLSPEEISRMEAEAKRLTEENQRKAEEAKAKAEAPLSAEEKREALSGLASRDSKAINDALTKLEAKSPLDPDPQIEAAIRKLLSHRDEKVADQAAKTLAKWSSEFKKQYNLTKAYEGPSPVDSSDLPVESTTKLFVGQIVQVQEHGSFWFPAKVKALLPDGKVRVDTLSWGKPGRELTLARRQIQLAPPEVQQPKGVAQSVASNSDSPGGGFQGIQTIESAVEINTPIRSWTDKTGRFKIEATFVTLENGSVELRRADGKTVKVPLAKLSQADQDFVKQTLDDNPFEIK